MDGQSNGQLNDKQLGKLVKKMHDWMDKLIQMDRDNIDDKFTEKQEKCMNGWVEDRLMASQETWTIAYGWMMNKQKNR